ncbi:putative methyltransferase YcgJ [Maioricimonas rarisocia]|uniref:Putative methyltransferase YcgJ n=1 Tax=Maioricimonas rarisocia TaxID=2528026 RepID=A0A517ZA03_9PLAN|nr:PQQ-binding-like beta-propeller repeat protein [Maioricimonas rarisocia]QDU39318.1 putative methyltransferase YcgJ [Maioricimonas rarisocia]
MSSLQSVRPSRWILLPLVLAFLAPTPSLPADDATATAERPRYEFREDHDPNGIGKFYMGREIARVMGHQGIAWLERPTREREEGLTDLIDALDLKPGMVVADIGAGSGVIAALIAERVGEKGTVLAVDIQQEMLDALAVKCRRLGIENIEPVLGTTKSPKLKPGTVDLVVMVDVYHEFDFPYEMLKEIAASLKPGGRVAFVEYRKEDPRVPIKEVHKMSEAQVKKEASLPEFGLEWIKTDGRLPRQHVVLFKKVGSGDDTMSRLDAWPQFRGPGGQGHVSSPKIPLEFGETENLTWKTAIPGTGWSSPVVLDNQIWMTTALDEGRSLRAVCVDRNDGRILHDVEVFTPEDPCPINTKNSHASPSPVVEPGRVYLHFGTMGTACLDTKTGEILWTNESLILDHKEGPGSSPVLYENLLIVTCDGMDVQYVTALDTATGQPVWKSERSAPLHDRPDFCKAYATPLIVQVDGKDQLISPGAHQVHGYDPATGAELWHVRYFGFSNVPRPLYDTESERIFLCTGYLKPQLWAIDPHGKGNVTDTNVLWKAEGQVPGRPSPILVNGRIYFVHDRGVATCVDAETGEVVWRDRMGGNYSASPIAVGDRIYFSSEEGKVTVIEATDEYRVLAENQLDAALMASPAVAGSSLFLRTTTHLYRFDAPAENRISARSEPAASAP